MRKQYTCRCVALRFKRWSRKGYAAFVSVKRAVTIGQLSAGISERSLVKGGSIHTSVLVSGKRGEKDEEEKMASSSDSSGGSPLMFLLLETILPLQTAGQPAEGVCAYTTERNISEIAEDRRHAAAPFRDFRSYKHMKEYD